MTDGASVPPWALSWIEWLGQNIALPIVGGLFYILYQLGLSKWEGREARLDEHKEELREIRNKLQSLEDAMNGGPKGHGIEAEVHEIRRMLEKQAEP